MKTGQARWDFFTNHAHVLFYLQAHPDQPLRKVALAVGITERAVQGIISDLEEGGYLKRTKVGRQNEYTIVGRAPLRHALEKHRSAQDLLDWVRVPEGDVFDDYRALENWTVGERGTVT